MSIFDEKLIHTRRLFNKEDVSREMGSRVLKSLERNGDVAPEVSPSGREFVSAHEAKVFHEALRR